MDKIIQWLRRVFTVNRRFLNGTLAEYLIVAAVYTGVTVVLTNFVLLNIGTQLFTGGSGDATAGFLWLNYADPGIEPALSPTNLVNYPEGEQLGGPTFITYLALWLPLRILSFLFGPVAGLNLMMLGGFLLAAMSGYWLLKRLTGSKLIAFFAGYAIAFVPYNLYKSVSHLAYLYCFPFVLMIGAFYGVWQKPNLLRALLFACTIALAFYTDGYYLLIASISVACLVLAGLVLTFLSRQERKRFITRLRAMSIAAGTLVVLCIPILYVQLSQGSQVSSMLSNSRATDPASEMRAYRARWEDFLLPSGQHPVWSLSDDFRQVSAYKELRSTPSECMNYIGYVILLLTIVGFILLLTYRFARKYSGLSRTDARTRKQLIFFGVILVISIPIFLAFMFSPATEFRGHTIYLPGQIMAHFGVGFWRVLARFFIPLHILLVIFAALVLNIIYKELSQRRGKKRLAAGVVLCAVVLTGFEFLTTHNMPSFDFRNMPAGYTWLKEQKDIEVVAELPMVDALDGMTGYYATAQIVHEKKLVNMKEPAADRLNNAIGSIDNPETINLAYQRGAQAVITHNIDCRNTVSWGYLLYRGQRSKDDPLCVYRLERPVDQDGNFAVFGTGFQYTAVRQQPYRQEITVDSNNANFRIVDRSLQANPSGRAATLTGTLRYVSDTLRDGTWMIKQGGKVLAAGGLEGQRTRINVGGIDTMQPVSLEIIYGDGTPVRDITTSLDDLRIY